VEDYIAWYVELADISEIPALIKGIADISIEDIKEGTGELYEIYTNLDEILAELTPKQKEYYTTYLKITLALELIPVKLNKVNKFKWKSDSKVLSKLKEFREKWCNYKPVVASSGGISVAGAGCKRLNDRSKYKWPYNYKNAWQDKNTILREKSFESSWRIYRGSTKSKIYKNRDDWNFYYRDSAWSSWDVWHYELEVFNKKYQHIWTADPATWIIDYSKAVSWRAIKGIMK